MTSRHLEGMRVRPFAAVVSASLRSSGSQTLIMHKHISPLSILTLVLFGTLSVLFMM